MTRAFRKNRWQFAIAFAALICLLFLFFKAQPVDPDTHNQVVSDISELQKRDIELAEEVLQLHFQLANNYDAAVALMQRIDELGAGITRHHQSGLLPDTPQLGSALTELKQQIARKTLALEDFKSGNAVMKNALIYLPVMVGRVLTEIPKSDLASREAFQNLLRDVLLLNVKGEADTIDVLKADIADVKQRIPGLSKKDAANAVIIHAQSLLKVNQDMPGFLVQLGSYQSRHLGEELGQLYQNYYQERQRTAAVYRLFLLLAAMLMLAYSIYVYYRLREQRLQIERALAEIDNQQQALNEHAIVSITDVEGRIIYVNDKFVEISGYSREELIGQNHRMIQSGEHDDDFFRSLWDSVASGSVWHGQIKNRTRDGKFYWVAATIVPFMDASGFPYQYVAMRTDITAQKQMEQQLAEDRRLLQNVMDTLGEGVYMLDMEGRCTYLNREAEAIIGWTTEELRGKKLHGIIHAELPDGTLVSEEDCPVHRSMMAKKIFRSEMDYFKHKNGTIFPIAIVASPVLDGDRIIGSVAAFQDVSERKFIERDLLNAKEAAEAASRAKGDFLATMSHEIRTPMNGIIGMTELALDTELSAEQREYMTLVKSSSESLLCIINDILDFSRIESGKMVLECTGFDIRGLCTALEKSMALRAGQKGLELILEVDKDIPDFLTGDPGRLRQILTNLVGNAIKFSDAGVIALRIKLLKNSVDTVKLHIEVADQGIGISAEQQTYIFDAFTQADTSTTRRYGGTGLGLAISSQMVAAMGGQLSVESELGEGSTFAFTITLPVAQGIVQSVEPVDLFAPSLPAAQRRLTILLAEDDPVKLSLAVLEKWGHQVVPAADGADVLERVGQQSFDVILMDMQMLQTGGLEATMLIREQEATTGRHTVIIAMSATNEDRQCCLDAGMDEYLSKPLDIEKLRAVLQGISPDESTGSAHSVEVESDYAAALAQVDDWVIESIGQAFLDQNAPQMAEMRDAILAGDQVVSVRSAHTLRGLVGNFNAQRLEEGAQQLALLSGCGSFVEAIDLYGKFEKEMGLFENALTARLSRLNTG